jgi:indolepyruvate ferredoxin oxidoreductase beta subunit
MVVNAQEIFPPSVATGQERYPQDVTERLRAVTDRLHMVDALAVALSMREVRAVNIVLVGAASHFLPLPEAAYEEAMMTRLPSMIVDVNVRAFRAGRELLRGQGTQLPTVGDTPSSPSGSGPGMSPRGRYVP